MSTKSTRLCFIFILVSLLHNAAVSARVQHYTTPLKRFTSPPAIPLGYLRHSSEWPLEMAAGNTLSLEGFATPGNFRLLHCRAYLDERVLRVVEWRSLDIMKTVPYAAISYVWRGNHQSPIPDSFAVEGATDSDRIDLEVLRVTCAAAGQKGADYIWMDKLCIMQTDIEDKNWQIQKMAKIYKHSTTCLVLLGGLGGLVGEGETTSWIYRSWTLQEVLLPENTYCIIKWSRGPGRMWGMTFEGDEQYAVVPLKWLLGWRLPRVDQPIIQLKTGPEQVEFTNIFSGGLGAVLALSGALTKNRYRYLGEGGAESTGERLRGRGLEGYNDEIESAVWRSITMRAATRDVDVVFSAMGMFGVELDPSRYKTQLEALIALLQKSLEYGYRVTWLVASLKSPGILPPLVSSLQHPPTTDSDWTDWYLANAPKGSLDSTGALTIIAPISPVKTDDIEYYLSGNLGFNGGSSGISGRPGTHVVKIGDMRTYSTIQLTCMTEPNRTLVMFIEPLANKWQKVGMGAISPEMTDGWEKQEIVIVGGTAD